MPSQVLTASWVTVVSDVTKIVGKEWAQGASYQTKSYASLLGITPGFVVLGIATDRSIRRSRIKMSREYMR